MGARKTSTPEPAKRVRITVDLEPAAYRELTSWTGRAAEELGVARLTIADAVRAMARVTALDKSVSAEVIDMIRRAREED